MYYHFHACEIDNSKTFKNQTQIAIKLYFNKSFFKSKMNYFLYNIVTDIL